MYRYNRLLIELDNAIKLSKSALPQEQQIAVILFDHLIEVVLFNAVRSAFEWPGSITVQQSLDSKARKNTLHKYDTVIAFLKRNGYLKDNDQALLSFTHGIRNEIYHKGSTEIDNTVLALTIYFHFIRKNKAILAKVTGLTAISGEPGYEPIDFGQGLSSDPFSRYMNNEEYISTAYDYLVGTMPNYGEFQDLARVYCSKIITDIERNLEYINESRKSLSFYEAISSSTLGETAPIFREFSRQGKKPKSLDSILLTAEFFRVYEELLDDLPSHTERLHHSRKWFRESRKGKKGKYPYWVKLPRIKERAEKIKKDRIEVAIQNFGGINSELESLSIDSSFATTLYSGYEMELFDRYRGK